MLTATSGSTKVREKEQKANLICLVSDLVSNKLDPLLEVISSFLSELLVSVET